MRTLPLPGIAPILFVLLLVLSTCSRANDAPAETTDGDQLVSEYFEQQTRLLTERSLADIEGLEDWTSKRAMYRQQLLDMLGLNPKFARTTWWSKSCTSSRCRDCMLPRICIGRRKWMSPCLRSCTCVVTDASWKTALATETRFTTNTTVHGSLAMATCGGTIVATHRRASKPGTARGRSMCCKLEPTSIPIGLV